jgi:hypothetical protein
MTMETPVDPQFPPPSTEELNVDRKLESLLDEMVAFSPTPPPDFAARVAEARPFAPWEVRTRRAWRAPLLVAAGLLAASLAVFLAPLGQLSPGTALRVWGDLLLAALSSPASAVFAAGPALAAGADALRSAVSPVAAAGVLGAGAVFGAAAVATLRRRAARARG